MCPLTYNNRSPMDLLSALKWRYATKKFDPTKKIPAADWKEIEESIDLTPSSYGVMPWRAVVVEDPALRAQLKPVSWNQSQVTDAAKFVVFARVEKIDEKFVDDYFALLAKVRGGKPEDFKGYRDMVVGDVVKGPRSAVAAEWAARQAYIGLGQAMLAAAAKGIDACPMEGFDPAAYDKILGLPGKGLRAVVALAFGYRAADDKYASAPKVRLPVKEVVLPA